MVDFGLIVYLKANNNVRLKYDCHDWTELTALLLPKIYIMEELVLDRSEVLNATDIELLKQITYDEIAVSVSEGYEKLVDPVYHTPDRWKVIFTKLSDAYFNKYRDNLIANAKEKGSLSSIRFVERQFVSFFNLLKLAEENEMQVAITVTDY